MDIAENYVARVLTWLPRTLGTRDQIGAELRSHIAERLAAGQRLEDVLRGLGDPALLAESYLAGVPLAVPPLSRRVAAKLVDLLLFVAVMALLMAPAVWSAAALDAPQIVPFAIVWALLLGTLLFALYTILSEWRFGQTVGKRLLGLRVVRESGARIGLGQSVVRQLPAAFQFYWVDVLFALFTDRQQRAFELLSKTRVVLAQE